MERGLEHISGWCLAKGTEQWSTLSACDSPSQTKFSHKIDHTSALARSVRWQQEVCGAGEEGRTIGNIVAQLIKLTGSCRQKAALPMFLRDTAVSLGSSGMGSPKAPTSEREPGRLLLLPTPPARPISPSLVRVGCTAKSWYLSWRNKFVSCNKCHRVSAYNVAASSPSSTQEGS